jgi:hypothetical protein
MMRLRRKLVLAAFAALGLLGVAQEVLAVVGRPLTPVSVAGVARRTSRRTVARQGAYYY